MRLINRQVALSFLAIAAAMACLAQPSVGSSGNDGGYGGLEFLGSSLTSRVELDKLLHLHNGSSVENAEKAVQRLKLELEKKSVKTNIDIIPDGANFFVAVDVIETGLNTKENRQLINPQHVAMPNEKAFAILDELKSRLQKLADEGRPASESYQDGYKVYSDFACTRTTEKIAQELEGQKPYMFKILATDPNNERRAAVTELLNWTPDPVRNCAILIPALDDSDMRVRMGAAKYIWARINLLPDDFPFDTLLEGLTRQLTRPSHHDRIRAMAALAALAKRDSDSISGIKTYDEAKLQEIAGNSVIPSVQNIAKQILSTCANPPPIQHKQKGPAGDFGSGF